MRGFLHGVERNKANFVRLAHFFKRPANARITRQYLAAIRRPFKGGNDDAHREAPLAASNRLQGWQGVKANSAVQLLLGHTKIESTVRYLGLEVDDALEIAEKIEV
jgi:hypothetical protein